MCVGPGDVYLTNWTQSYSRGAGNLQNVWIKTWCPQHLAQNSMIHHPWNKGQLKCKHFQIKSEIPKKPPKVLFYDFALLPFCPWVSKTQPIWGYPTPTPTPLNLNGRTNSLLNCFNPRSRDLDPGPWAQDPAYRIADPGSWIQDPGSKQFVKLLVFPFELMGYG